MALFSERYGYTKPADVLIREKITEEIENALCSCYDMLNDHIRRHMSYKDETYKEMELFLWMNFLNKRHNDFYRDFGGYMIVATYVLKEKKYPWFQKLNMVEMSVKWFYKKRGENDQRLFNAAQSFTALINHEFERLNYAYRFVDKEIVEITSKEEIVSIEQAIKDSENNVKLHLQTALGLLAKKPSGDYRNSIKESISAVEAVCRELTGKSTLGDALNELEKTGVVIPKVMKLGFDKLYGYTNNKETGIRHALMDNDGSYIPSSDEAVFMLVSCSAFINYLYAKKAK